MPISTAALLEALPQALLLLDGEGRICAANTAAAESLQVPVEALMGRAWEGAPFAPLTASRTALPDGTTLITLTEPACQHLQGLLNTVQGILWEADAQTFTFRFISEQAERLLGYPREDWYRPGFWAEHLHPEDRERAVSYCMACTGRLESHDFEYRFLAQDGRVVWLRDIVSVVPDAHGQPALLQGLMVDISARKMHEARFGSLLRTATDGIWLVGSEGQILLANETAAAMLRYSLPELLQRSLRDIEALETPQELASHVRQIMREGAARFETLHRRSDGTVFPVEVSTTYLPDTDQFVAFMRDLSDRKTAEAALAAGHRRLESVLDATRVGVWEWDFLAGTGSINDRWAEMLGYQREELERLDMEVWEILCHPEDRPRFHAELENHLSGKKAFYECDLRLRHKEGHWVWIHDRGQVVEWTADGQPWRMLGTHQDISERKELEEALFRNALQWRTLFEGLPIGVALVDGDFQILEANPAARCILALPPEARTLAPDDGRRHFSPDGRPFPWEAFPCVRALREGMPVADVKVGVALVGKPTRWVMASSQRVSGNPVRILATLVDITPMVAAEEAIRAGEARYRSLLEETPLPICLHQEGRFVLANPAATKLFGAVSEQELLGRSILDFVHPDDREQVLQRVKGSLEQGVPAPVRSERLLTLQGDTLICEITGHPLMVDGAPTMLVFMVDVTERHRLEAVRLQVERKLLEAQRMDSLGALAGGVAHDMNNVLGAIMGLAEIHQRQTPAGNPLHDDMATVLRACLRGRTMVKGLLEFARKDLGEAEVEVVDLNRLVREQVALLERTTLQKVDLVMDLAPHLPGIRGERSPLNHALMNLCINAVQAMPEGGTLTLRTRVLPGDVVSLEVEDTGGGMTPEVLSHAVDPFFTTRPAGEGTGLGLSMVYGVTTSHGGTLELSSQPGLGTQVRLSFPGCPGPTDEARMAVGVSESSSTALRVLVVDDDELIRDTISGLLELLGFEPHLAVGGAEALDLLEGGLAPDRVILDINMPGMDGRQILERIRARWTDLRVLVASGRMEPAAKAAMQEVPNVGFLPKPFTLEELQDALR